MEAVAKEDYEAIRKRYEEAGQDHIFKYYSEYSDSEKEAFLDQLRAIDLTEIERLYKEV